MWKIVLQVVARFSAAEWEIPEDFLSYSHFERVVKDLDWNSSPGYPYLLQYSTNRLLFQVVDGVPSEESKLMIWRKVMGRLQDRTSDPIRLFIKPEPHKIKKIEQHRYRLISSVSVVDQIIDHMLFGTMNKAMNDNYLMLPSKIGWSPYQGGWKIVPANKMIATDKTAWDWTVKEWLVKAELLVRDCLCRSRTSESGYTLWKELAHWRYKQLYYDAIFVTSGGDLLRQKEPGVMKSGSVNTINSNSIMQDLIHVRACFDINEVPVPIWAMGDDTLQYRQQDMPMYRSFLSRYCVLKDSTCKTEFAGNEFRVGGRVEPLYFGKHMFNLLHVDPEIAEDLCFAYMLLYHRSSRRDVMEKILTELGNVPVREYLDYVFDG